MKPKSAPAKALPPGDPVPGVMRHDQVFVRISGQPDAARVLATGEHGVTVHHGGGPRRVYWRDVLGYKQRAEKNMRPVDCGEDGAIVEDEGGRRHFVAGYREGGAPGAAAAPASMSKSLMPKVIFFGDHDVLAKAIKNGAGLTQKDITDKTGRHQKHWVRIDKGMEDPGGGSGAGDDEKRGAAAGYGTHNLHEGSKVSFEKKDGAGAGKIVGIPGKDGAHVEDATGKVHEVRWSEVTGHDKNGAKKPAVESAVLGEQKPISADKFSAADYAASHDKADVTPEEIMSSFPPDTAAKIAATQKRLSGIEETIDEFKKDGAYDDSRREIHQKIFDHFLSDARVAAATPQEGEEPTFTILGGRGGSGKSWFKKHLFDPSKAIVLDADEIKGMLPEYEGWNAAQVHGESSDLFEELTDQAQGMGLNIVHDATMKTSKKAVALVERFREDGYRTEAHYMHLPRQEAAKRAVARFLGESQRYVPVDVVLSNTSNEDSFDQVRGKVDRWSFRDNNVAAGEQPILISEGGDTDAPDAAEKKDAAPSPVRARLAERAASGGGKPMLKKALGHAIVWVRSAFR